MSNLSKEGKLSSKSKDSLDKETTNKTKPGHAAGRTTESVISADSADSTGIPLAEIYHPTHATVISRFKNLFAEFKSERTDYKGIDTTHAVPGYGIVDSIVGIRQVPILRSEHAYLTLCLHSMEAEQGDGSDDCLICCTGGELFLCDTCDNAFHSECLHGYTPTEDEEFRCHICLGVSTLYELVSNYADSLTEKQRRKKHIDAYLTDIKAQEDLTNGLEWTPPNGQGADGILKKL